MEQTKLIATYARVSTARQEEERTIKTQYDVLKDEILQKGYTVVREYSDDGWSGDTLARPGLDQLRTDAKNKLFDAVLVYDPDRLARRYSYQELIMDELKEAGIEVIFITISAPKNIEDKILHGVRGLFAEYERAKISERFRLGKVRKVKEGHLLVSEPLYGYDYNPKEDKRHGYYTINEREAAIVLKIFTWVADEGLTLRKIVRRLQELDIKPRKSKRGVWSTSTLTSMLRNKGYIGEAHWGSSYAVVPMNPTSHEKYRKNKKSSRKIRPENEWYSIPIQAIIERELFDRARKQLDTNYALCQRNTKNEYLLGKKIWCICGNRRAGEGPRQGKYLYYRCNDRVLSFPLARSCNEKGINARIADNLVWENVVALMSSPELISKQIKRWLAKRENKDQTTVDDIDSIMKEIEKLKNEGDRYNKAYGAGVFTIEQLNEYALPLRERIKNLNAQILKLRQEKNQIDFKVLPSEEQIESFAIAARKKLGDLNFLTKRAIVVNVIEKVVGNQEKLLVYGNIPISIDSNVAFYSDDRSRQNTTRLFEGEKNGSIHFELTIELPPPLKRGVDYGFRPGLVTTGQVE